MSQESYIIVGSGVFGASSALELARCKPDAHILLLDQQHVPNPSAASSDLNKIIRADYRDPMYAKLALDAMECWKADPLFAPYFHQTGMLFAESDGKGPASLRNLQSLGAADGARLMTVDEARDKFPAFQTANWTGVSTAYYNPNSGWGEADPAMKAMIDEATRLGVVLHEALVARLILEAHETQLGRRWLCNGVVTADGTALRADKVLICTGAHTAKLLADSAPNEPSLQVNGRLVAAAALQCSVRLPPAKWPKCRDAPVFANLMSHTSGKLFAATFCFSLALAVGIGTDQKACRRSNSYECKRSDKAQLREKFYQL
jgi:sarcosine oxidase / L-pipecolate oxidase